MIFETAIRQWQQHCPWREQRHVEQDMILHAMLQVIYSDAYLSEHLAFRGGTCLNKLYLKHPYRYSEDLDFVQISAGKIGPIADRLKTVLTSIFADKPAREASKGSFKLNYSFFPEGSPYRQKIKIEINTREHFAVKGHVRKPFVMDSSWHSGKADIVTFTLEELLATKLRALYQRRKGRDLFDLWICQELKPNYGDIVDIFLEYMLRNDTRVTRDEFIRNLNDKMERADFFDDVRPLLRPEIVYETHSVVDYVQKTLLALLPV